MQLESALQRAPKSGGRITLQAKQNQVRIRWILSHSLIQVANSHTHTDTHAHTCTHTRTHTHTHAHTYTCMHTHTHTQQFEMEKRLDVVIKEIGSVRMVLRNHNAL